MGTGKRILSFGGGGVVGFLVGAGIAKLVSAQRGDELRASIDAKIDEIKAIGDAAQAATEQRLIARFRGDVDDPTALAPEAQRADVQRSRAMQALGLGLNAPGAIAAQHARDRAGESPLGPLDLNGSGKRAST